MTGESPLAECGFAERIAIRLVFLDFPFHESGHDGMGVHPCAVIYVFVEIKMDNIEDCRDVLGFHQVVTLGNHRRVVEAFCQLYGIKVIHSPEHTAHGKAA